VSGANNANDTGRAAFEQWEALGEAGHAPLDLAHSAALLVEVAEATTAGQWQPDAPERRSCRLLLKAIAAATSLLWIYCPWEETPTPAQSAAIARRAGEIINEEYGLIGRADALGQAAKELGIELEPPPPPNRIE